MKTKSDVLAASQREHVLEQALLDYQRELISLGRLAELLGVDRLVAGEIVEARGMQVRFAPTSIEEALEDARVAQALSDS